MRNSPAYEVRNLRKVYTTPAVVANEGVSFSVHPGEAFGLLGPNGAGKTTLVRQLVGLLTPTSGDIHLFGEKLNAGLTRGARLGRTVAYLPQGVTSLGELKVREAIRWTAMLRGCGRSTADTESEELMATLELDSLGDRQLRKLSGGQRRLVQIGMTLVGRLPVLILDEPTADIDPSLRKRIWRLLAERARGGAAVILVTHDVAEAEQVLDRVAILHGGKVAATGTPAELKAGLSHRTRVEVVLADTATTAATDVAKAMSDTAVVGGRRIDAWVPAEDALRVLEKVMASIPQGDLEDVRLITPSLQDVYLALGEVSSEGEGGQ
jgi:ABC-2 type transport system ATP-binding protein